MLRRIRGVRGVTGVTGVKGVKGVKGDKGVQGLARCAAGLPLPLSLISTYNSAPTPTSNLILPLTLTRLLPIALTLL